MALAVGNFFCRVCLPVNVGVSASRAASNFASPFGGSARLIWERLAPGSFCRPTTCLEVVFDAACKSHRIARGKGETICTDPRLGSSRKDEHLLEEIIENWRRDLILVHMEYPIHLARRIAEYWIRSYPFTEEKSVEFVALEQLNTIGLQLLPEQVSIVAQQLFVEATVDPKKIGRWEGYFESHSFSRLERSSVILWNTMGRMVKSHLPQLV